MSINAIITLEAINKYYTIGEHSLHVLKDVSLTVKRGEYLSILGASGSGKTTLMNIIGCMDVCDSGRYWMDGRDISCCNKKELAHIRNNSIGFVFQKYHLITQYNVLENIIMPLLIQGFRRREAVERADEMICLMGLTDRIHHRPKELSGGQQQRVAIARALVTNPAVLLADEPTGALDSGTGKEILTLFKELNERGNTIIQITHDTTVASYSQRIVTMNDGVLVEK